MNIICHLESKATTTAAAILFYRVLNSKTPIQLKESWAKSYHFKWICVSIAAAAYAAAFPANKIERKRDSQHFFLFFYGVTTRKIYNGIITMANIYVYVYTYIYLVQFEGREMNEI